MNSIVLPLLAVETPSAQVMLSFFVVVGGAGLFIAWLLGCFRRASVLGPDRMDSTHQVSPLWVTVFATISVWIMLPGIYVGMTSPPTTGPTTVRSVQLSGQERIALNLIVTTIAFAVLLVVGKMMSRGLFERIGSTFRFIPRGVRLGALACLAMVPLMFATLIGFQLLYTSLNYEHPSEHEMLRILSQESSSGLKWVVIVTAVVVAPLFEEFLFRGCIQTGIVGLLSNFASLREASRMSQPAPAGATAPVLDYASQEVRAVASPWLRWVAIVLASIVFALVHGELWLMLPIFVLSLMIGYAYERTGNLWVCITMHAIFNLLNVAQFLGR